MHYTFQRLFLHLFTFIFIFTRSIFPFLFDRSQSKASVVNQISHLFFEAQKYFYALFNFLKMVIYRTLIRR